MTELAPLRWRLPVGFAAFRPGWLSVTALLELVYMAGATGLEPATYGFGDRCATNCATPLGHLDSAPNPTTEASRLPREVSSDGEN